MFSELIIKPIEQQTECQRCRVEINQLQNEVGALTRNFNQLLENLSWQTQQPTAQRNDAPKLGIAQLVEAGNPQPQYGAAISTVRSLLRK